MKPRSTVVVALVGAAIAAGCAYYNGLYNANQLVDQARKAEREGRRDEARSLWERVAVKAESVAVRHPNSKHRDDALVLWGGALAANDQCSRARHPLTTALESSSDTVLLKVARFELGRCQVKIGDPRKAVATLTPLVRASSAPDERGLRNRDAARPYVLGATAENLSHAARFWRARAHVLNGDFQSARVDFEQCDQDVAAYELALVYAHLKLLDEAFGILETQASNRYVEELWLPTLDSLGLFHTALAARLVDRLLARDGLHAEQRARLLGGDARRWIARGRFSRGIERFDQLLRDAPATQEGARARVERAVARLRSATTFAMLSEVADSLLAALGEPTATSGPFAVALDIAELILPNRGEVATGTTTPERPPREDEQGGSQMVHSHSDLALFVAAELARDSLRAPILAATLFGEVRDRFPQSAIAPKALIAHAQLNETVRDSLLDILRVQYADSPYTLALMGEDAPRFAVLEDSLRIALEELRSIRVGSHKAESERRNPE